MFSNVHATAETRSLSDHVTSWVDNEIQGMYHMPMGSAHCVYGDPCTPGFSVTLVLAPQGGHISMVYDDDIGQMIHS